MELYCSLILRLYNLYRIGRSRRSRNASFDRGAGGILPSLYEHSNPRRLSRRETVSGGQFDWGGRLLKGNGGAQRFPSEWLEIIHRV